MKKKLLVGAALSVIVTAAGTGLNTRPVDAAEGKSVSNKNTTQSASTSAQSRTAAEQADLTEQQNREDKKKADTLKKRLSDGESLTSEEEAWLASYDARIAKEAESLILDPSTEVLTERDAVSGASSAEATASTSEAPISESTVAESESSEASTAESDSTSAKLSASESSAARAEHSASSAEQDAAEADGTASTAQSAGPDSESDASVAESVHSVAESSASVTENTASVADDAASVAESSTPVEEDAASVTESSTPVKENAASVTESSSSAVADSETSIGEVSGSIADGTSDAVESHDSQEETAATAADTSSPVIATEIIPAEPLSSDLAGSTTEDPLPDASASRDTADDETESSTDNVSSDTSADREDYASAAKPAVRHAVMRIAKAVSAPAADNTEDAAASSQTEGLTAEETQTIENALTSTELIAADGGETELALKKAELLFTSSLRRGYSLQGSTAIGDSKIAYAFINDDDDSDITLLYMYDAETGKITLMNDKLRLGHASSLTWNSRTNEVMILDGATVHILDADTLQEKGSAKASESGFGIAYNADDDTYILRDSKKFWIADSHFNYVRGFSAKVNPMGQGMGYSNGVVYLVDSDYYSGNFTNNIRAYDLSGNLLKTFNITDILGECEEVSFQNGSMILGYIRGWKMPDYNYPVVKGNYNWTVEFYKSNDYILNYGRNGIQTLPANVSQGTAKGQAGKNSEDASQGSKDTENTEVKSVLLNTGSTDNAPVVKGRTSAEDARSSSTDAADAKSAAGTVSVSEGIRKDTAAQTSGKAAPASTTKPAAQQTAETKPSSSAAVPASEDTAGTKTADSAATAGKTPSVQNAQADNGTHAAASAGSHTTGAMHDDLSFGTDYDLIDPVAGENLTTGGSADVTDPVTTSESIDYSPVYDYDYYISHNPDVASRVGNDKKAALDHFVKKGMSEGRRAKESFDVSSYRNANQDLRILFGSDLKPYFMHYIRTGQSEGRTAVGVSVLQNPVMVYNGVDFSKIYDYFFYVNKYIDLPDSIRNDDVKALRYFGTYGIFNGQIAKRLYSASDYLDVLKHLV